METIVQNNTNTIKFKKKYEPIINGEMVEPINGYIDVVDAASGKFLSQIGRGGNEDIDRAVKAARAAFPVWSKTTIEKRALLLNKIAIFYFYFFLYNREFVEGKILEYQSSWNSLYSLRSLMNRRTTTDPIEAARTAKIKIR
ncbi:aldehyde dehydrogenase family protein [Peribacillus sp. NPDC076916]|uniref:aldehyde dehydrogenase family protein n=1 Tax=Peribacillus sp. NPDC076916 TaxID=3390608 RepID=UPI003D012F07